MKIEFIKEPLSRWGFGWCVTSHREAILAVYKVNFVVRW